MRKRGGTVCGRGSRLRTRVGLGLEDSASAPKTALDRVLEAYGGHLPADVDRTDRLAIVEAIISRGVVHQVGILGALREEHDPSRTAPAPPVGRGPPAHPRISEG